MVEVEMETPRVLAEFADYDGFLEALRARARELKIALSADQNADVVGLPSGYLAKLIGSNPVKRVGAKSFGPILGAFGLKLVMVEDVAALELYGKRLRTRNGNLVRSAASHLVVTHKFLRKIGKLGGLRRVAKQSPAQRRRSARFAAMARWHGEVHPRKIDRI